MKKYLSFVFLFCIAVPAQAAPLLYQISGQIYDFYNPSAGPEDFTGSFVMSDVTFIDYYSNDPTDTRGAYVTFAGLSDFTLTSASYSLTGQGAFQIAWGPNEEIYYANTSFDLSTSAGWGDTYDVTWNGPMNAQPSSMIIDRLAINSDTSSLHISNMTAVATPLPAAAWLFGSGLLGLVGISRRRRPRRANEAENLAGN